MAVRQDLIFDVGVCNGDDSAYYLHKGYRVIGVEASPVQIPHLRRRFAEAIRAGRYELVPMGIAQSEGQAQFWVCDDHAEWSSFDQSIASRSGARHHPVSVQTCRFATLLERFGIPHYCKIDIEGNDDLCLEDMRPDSKPDFISVEVIDPQRQIGLLGRLGYSRFKLISQRTFRQPGNGLAALKLAVGKLSLASRLFTAVEARLCRVRSDGGWRFPGGSSGPFGAATAGDWLAPRQAVDLACLLERRRDCSDWFDIHAAL